MYFSPMTNDQSCSINHYSTQIILTLPLLVPYVFDITCEETMQGTNNQTGKAHWIQLRSAEADLKKSAANFLI